MDTEEQAENLQQSTARILAENEDRQRRYEACRAEDARQRTLKWQERERNQMERHAEDRRERRRQDWRFLFSVIGWGVVGYFLAVYVFHL
jgi:hypothetical protein